MLHILNKVKWKIIPNSLTDVIINPIKLVLIILGRRNEFYSLGRCHIFKMFYSFILDQELRLN